jgi:malate/lactate dehydrogenase
MINWLSREMVLVDYKKKKLKCETIILFHCELFYIQIKIYDSNDIDYENSVLIIITYRR